MWRGNCWKHAGHLSCLQAQERHAVAAVAKEQEAFAADQLGTALAQQHAMTFERLRAIASQVHARAEDAQQLQQRVSRRVNESFLGQL